MKNISNYNVSQKEIKDAGSTVINFGIFKDTPMTLTDIIRRNNVREIKWLYFIGTLMPIVKEDKRMNQIKKNIVIYLESLEIYKNMLV
ncbi:MAG: hypothetical protein ACYDEX_19485 [Mobilitalea sp.]